MNEQVPANQLEPDMSEFTIDELVSLRWLQTAYAANSTTEQLEANAELQRLQFVRWMVQTGKLSDQLS